MKGTKSTTNIRVDMQQVMDSNSSSRRHSHSTVVAVVALHLNNITPQVVLPQTPTTPLLLWGTVGNTNPTLCHILATGHLYLNPCQPHQACLTRVALHWLVYMAPKAKGLYHMATMRNSILIPHLITMPLEVTVRALHGQVLVAHHPDKGGHPLAALIWGLLHPVENINNIILEVTLCIVYLSCSLYSNILKY